jgi:hypothetical protein
MNPKEEIEVKIEPNSASLRYFCIKYRPKKRINWFNWWSTLVQVWDGAYLTYDQPVLFESFENAVRYGKMLKQNPILIKEHYERQDKIYSASLKRRKEYSDNRNKSTII